MPYEGYQLIRVGTYAAELGPQALARGDKPARAVIGEAVREGVYHKHVPHPQAPLHIDGGRPEDALSVWQRHCQEARDALGRPVPPTWPTLVGIVASHPAPPTPEALQDPGVRRWLVGVRDFVRRHAARAGAQIVTAVLHRDEGHLHTHHLLCPLDPRTPLSALHPGNAAAYRAKRDGKPRWQQVKAASEALRAYMDLFFEEVALPAGLARMGPRKTRKTPAEYAAAKREAAAIGAAIRRLEADRQRLDAQRQELDAAWGRVETAASVLQDARATRQVAQLRRDT